jgi:hypothetical protein
MTATGWTSQSTGTAAYADVNGVHLYFETHGEGRPRGGHALAIVPGTTHYNLAVSPLFAAVALAFLDAPRAEP